MIDIKKFGGNEPKPRPLAETSAPQLMQEMKAKNMTKFFPLHIPPCGLKHLVVLAVVLALMPVVDATAANKPQGLLIAPMGFRGLLVPKWPHDPVEIHVTQIEAGSPSDGTDLKIGDIVVGIGNEKFAEHPLPALAKAVDIGEAAGGNLTLLLKDGKQVTIKLADLGAYSDTAPYNCAKTDALIEQAVEQLMKEEGLGSTPTRTGLLGLMATGEQRHLDVVTKFIQNSDMIKVDPQLIDQYLKTGQPNLGSTGWTWGYNLIVLSEYYLLTKDEAVLPAIRTYALGLAKGQDAVGLWGHRVATAASMGRIPGYGIMNQCSLSNFMGMLLARKCGIQDPVLDEAIEKTNAYVAHHIDKGGFPYGVHGPTEEHFNNNGTSGMAAICMALMGNKEGAAFFSRSCLPTHDKLTLGHASHFFNPLWTPLGASLSGPEATQQFFKQSLWYFNRKRHWEGGFPGKGRAGFFAGQALLTYCLPRKVLYITGREADESIWIKGDELDRLIELNRFDYDNADQDELFAMLRDPLVQVRAKAAKELSDRLTFTWGRKLGKDPISPTLLDMIKNGSEQEKIIALKALGGIFRGYSTHFADRFVDVMNDPTQPYSVRVAAAEAFRNCGEGVFPYFNDILRFVLEERPERPDRFGHTDRTFALAIEQILRDLKTPEAAQGLKTDKVLLYGVASRFLDHPRQNVRGVGIKLLDGIKLKDFHIVGAKLMYVLKDEDLTYHSYSSVLNADGIGILAELNIKEGLDLLEEGIFEKDGKWGFKYSALLKSLPKYGANAQPYIAKYEAHPDINKKGDRFTPHWEKVVETIEQDQHPKKLITAQEAIQLGEESRDSQ
jgi:hypothetical protein